MIGEILAVIHCKVSRHLLSYPGLDTFFSLSQIIRSQEFSWKIKSFDPSL